METMCASPCVFFPRRGARIVLLPTHLRRAGPRAVNCGAGRSRRGSRSKSETESMNTEPPRPHHCRARLHRDAGGAAPSGGDRLVARQQARPARGLFPGGALLRRGGQPAHRRHPARPGLPRIAGGSLDGARRVRRGAERAGAAPRRRAPVRGGLQAGHPVARPRLRPRRADARAPQQRALQGGRTTSSSPATATSTSPTRGRPGCTTPPGACTGCGRTGGSTACSATARARTAWRSRPTRTRCSWR